MDEQTGSTSGSTQSTTDELKSKAQDAAKQAKTKAQGVAQKLKGQGKQQLETGKESAAHKAEQLADAVNRASDELHQQDEHGLADYASQVAGSITTFADTLRNRSIDDLIAETQSLARRNPTLFFLGSIGMGVALARFLKASARKTSGMHPEEQDLNVSYSAGSEWQQPDASQSVYGGQPQAVYDAPSTGGTQSATGEWPEAGSAGTGREPPSPTAPPTGGPYP